MSRIVGYYRAIFEIELFLREGNWRALEGAYLDERNDLRQDTRMDLEGCIFRRRIWKEAFRQISGDSGTEVEITNLAPPFISAIPNFIIIVVR